jgi:DNA modification methylase
MNTIPIDNIKVENRAREEFGNLEELVESLLRYGFIHPIALDKDRKLVAGGRRFASLNRIWKNRVKHLGNQEDIHPTMVRFLESGNLELGKHYTSIESENVAHLSEMELEENVRRKAFTWKEEIIAIARIHHKKKKTAVQNKDRWGVRETGRVLGVSHASVGYALQLYACLQDPEHKIQECKSVTDALHTLTKMRLDEARRLAIKQNVKTLPKATNEVTDDDLMSQLAGIRSKETEGPLEELEGFDFGDASAFEESDGSISDEEVTFSLDNFMYGDFLTLLEDGSLAPESVDHVLTDPPYGIDMRNLRMKQGGGVQNTERIEDTHSVEDNVANFAKWIQGFYDVMKPNGFCIMFCDFVHFNLLNGLATDVGFKAQRWPFVWCKTHQCMNQAGDFNFTKNIEIACVWRKGSATLTTPQNTSYMQASSLPTKQKLQGHPFVKPLELWTFLAKAVAIEGETILDPFSGVGSMPRALMEKYRVVTCEIDENIHNQQISMVMDHISSIYDKVNFVRSGSAIEPETNIDLTTF